MIRILSILAALLLFTAHAAATAPAVTTAPKVGPPTTKITVIGTGFAVTQLIDIYFDQTDLCLTASSDTGSFSCTIKVPKDAQPQTHWLTAVQRFTGTAAQGAFTVRTDMAQLHGRNAAHSGVNPFENTLNASNVGNLETLWSVPIGTAGTFGSPVVASGIVYVGGMDGKLYGFSAATGTAVAGFPVNIGPSITYSTPAVGGGRVFIGTDGSGLYAFNAATGAAVAGFPQFLGGHVQSPPSLALGNVYVGCNDGKLYAFNATTGAAVSGFPVATGGTIFASPTIINGRVYIGTANHNIHAFDALTGAAVPGFPKAAGGQVLSTVGTSNGMGFAGTDNGVLQGFNLGSGGNLGGFPLGPFAAAAIYSSPAAAGGKVYFGSTDNTLHAHYTTGGGLAWNTSLDSEVQGSPMVANGVVYVSSTNRVYALAASTGAVLWSAAATLGELNSPVVADGVVYYASIDGFLYAYGVNGLPVSARLPGGALGVKPAMTMLRPDLSLRPVRN